MQGERHRGVPRHARAGGPDHHAPPEHPGHQSHDRPRVPTAAQQQVSRGVQRHGQQGGGQPDPVRVPSQRNPSEGGCRRVEVADQVLAQGREVDGLAGEGRACQDDGEPERGPEGHHLGQHPARADRPVTPPSLATHGSTQQDGDHQGGDLEQDRVAVLGGEQFAGRVHAGRRGGQPRHRQRRHGCDRDDPEPSDPLPHLRRPAHRVGGQGEDAASPRRCRDRVQEAADQGQRVPAEARRVACERGDPDGHQPHCEPAGRRSEGAHDREPDPDRAGERQPRSGRRG